MSFQQGLSGLNAAAKQLDAIGNNVANASTVGFKQSQAQFADLYAVSLAGGGGVQVGSGVKLAGVVQQFTQGNITNTNNAMDTAISGQGFYVMTDANGATRYTRNGQFQVDKNGFIVNNQGHQVNGFQAVAGVLTATQGPLQINAADLVPKQSSQVDIGANLDSRATVPQVATFDPVVPTSYNNSTSLTVYDSLGVSHVATLYFQRQAIPDTTASADVAVGATTATLASVAGMAVGNTITLPGAGGAATASSTSPLAVAAGATTVTPASVAGMSVGDTITIAGAGNVGTITGIAGGVVTFAPATTAGPTALNAVVTTYSTATDLTTTISAINGNVVTFSPATTSPVPSGATVASNAGSADWNVYLAVDGAQVPLAGSALAVLNFDTTGTLTTATPAGVSTAGPGGTVISDATFTPLGANPLPLTFDFNNISQYGGNFGVSSLTQDGYASGRLNGFSTSSDGTILGRYSNGQSQALGQILLANFTNPQGLTPVGDNEWVESAASGAALVGVPGSSSLGLLQSSAVEESNVDLTAELVSMITAQRVYQANAQTIKAQDQVLQTLVNLR